MNGFVLWGLACFERTRYRLAVNSVVQSAGAALSAGGDNTQSSNLTLPAGLRDLLPAEAFARRNLARRMLELVELHGYSPVLLPAFEWAEVLERGLGTLDPTDVIRFVEPGSGEVAALRPDMTPQVARMVASRMKHTPPPIRVAYEGTVLRRRQERARKHRQIPQAGVELLGVSGPDGDIEVLLLAARCLDALEVENYVLDVGHAAIARSLLAELPTHAQSQWISALSVKDSDRVGELLQNPSCASLPSSTRDALRQLPLLHGGVDVLKDAAGLLKNTPAEPAFDGLRTIIGAAEKAGLRSHLRVDLGEVRGFAYYTGLLFHALADGPGAPLGGGGRYDDLLGCFGAEMPAVGFAFDLDHVAWARRSAGLVDPRPCRVAISARDGVEELANEVILKLRAEGVSALNAPVQPSEKNLKTWAEGAGCSALVLLNGSTNSLLALDTSKTLWQPTSGERDAITAQVIATWITSVVRS